MYMHIAYVLYETMCTALYNVLSLLYIPITDMQLLLQIAISVDNTVHFLTKANAGAHLLKKGENW